MSVCLSVTFVHCAQTAEAIDTISLAHDSLPDRVKVWLTCTSVYPFFPRFCHKVTLHSAVDLSVADIGWQTAADWPDIVQWSQWRLESLWETIVALSNDTIDDPLRPPLPLKGFPIVTDFFCMSDVAFYPWPLFYNTSIIIGLTTTINLYYLAFHPPHAWHCAILL